MVLSANTGLLFSDEDSLRANPGSSSSVCSDEDACGGCWWCCCFSTSDQPQHQTMVKSLRERCEQQNPKLLKSTKETQEASAKARDAEEVIKSLTAEVKSLRERCEQQELELLKSTRETQEASAKVIAAKEVIKSLTNQVLNLRQICEQQELQLQISTKKTQEAMAREIIKPPEAQLEDMTKRLTRYRYVDNQHNQKLTSIHQLPCVYNSCWEKDEDWKNDDDWENYYYWENDDDWENYDDWESYGDWENDDDWESYDDWENYGAWENYDDLENYDDKDRVEWVEEYEFNLECMSLLSKKNKYIHGQSTIEDAQDIHMHAKSSIIKTVHTSNG